jgi:tRNA/rRNA methyltransferase
VILPVLADTTHFILVNTSHAGNVGAAARALKVMGFDAPGQLILLEPRYDNVQRKQEAIALASGALDVLTSAQLILGKHGHEQALNRPHPNLLPHQRERGPDEPSPQQRERGRDESVQLLHDTELDLLAPSPASAGQGGGGGAAIDTQAWQTALGEATYTIALTARGRDFGPPAFALRVLCEQVAKQPQHKVAFVFGSERYGLPNELVYKCNAVAHIPANPNYSSLNLAQSLMLVSYEWSQALQAAKASLVSQPASPPSETMATQAAVQGMLGHWQAALTQIEFLDPDAPKKLMPRLQRLFNRAELTEQEVHILRGIAKNMMNIKRE